MDIGLGFQEANGELISSSAYDSALNGLDFLGYGTEDGTPNNIVSIMWQMGEIFEGYDIETNTWTNGTREDAQALMEKLEGAADNLNEMYTKLDADTKYLNTNLDRLTTTKDNLNEQIVNVEDVDKAQAIMDLVWAQQAYNAALKIGTNIIPQSLLDYMN